PIASVLMLLLINGGDAFGLVWVAFLLNDNPIGVVSKALENGDALVEHLEDQRFTAAAGVSNVASRLVFIERAGLVGIHVADRGVGSHQQLFAGQNWKDGMPRHPVVHERDGGKMVVRSEVLREMV